MMAVPRDTIVALATPPEPGVRAIVRISGPEALRATQRMGGPVALAKVKSCASLPLGPG